MSIEIYTERYKIAVAELIIGIQREEFTIPVTLEMQPDLENIPGYYQVNNGNFWVAKINEQLVGTIALLDIGNSQGALRKMFVAPEARGKDHGVAQGLLQTLMDWAMEKHYLEIFLGTTEKFTRAQRFYEKYGFDVIEKNELPRAFPVMEVDVKFYRKTTGF